MPSKVAVFSSLDGRGSSKCKVSYSSSSMYFYGSELNRPLASSFLVPFQIMRWHPWEFFDLTSFINAQHKETILKRYHHMIWNGTKNGEGKEVCCKQSLNFTFFSKKHNALTKRPFSSPVRRPHPGSDLSAITGALQGVSTWCPWANIQHLLVSLAAWVLGWTCDLEFKFVGVNCTVGWNPLQVNRSVHDSAQWRIEAWTSWGNKMVCSRLTQAFPQACSSVRL